MSLHKLTAGDGYMYLIRQVAAADDTARGRASLGDYYSSKGETPGRWMGRGLAALSAAPAGVADGQTGDPWKVAAGSEVTEMQMKALFGQGLHPNREEIVKALLAQGTPLKDAEKAGRLGYKFRVEPDQANEFRTRLKSAYEDHNRAAQQPPWTPIGEATRAGIRTRVATEVFTAHYQRAPKDSRELSGFIARNTRTATKTVAGYDLTFTPVKSISTVWGLAPRALSEAIEALHHEAIADTLRWAEDHVAFTRMGTNGVAQVKATGLIAAAFDHRDSRAGDPNLHTHVVVSNKVQAIGPDGIPRWLALDGQILYRNAVALSEQYNTLIEGKLVERLGFTFKDVPTAAGRRSVREIDGVPPELLEAYSSRRTAIVDRVGDLATAFQREHGREPTTVEFLALSQKATTESRQAKHAPRSLAEQRDEWRRQAIQILGSVRDLDEMIATISGRTTKRVALTDELVASLAASVIATVSSERATWRVQHVRAEAERQLRGNSCYADSQHAADRIVAAALGDRSIQISRHVDEERNEPAFLRRNDGASVYRQHHSTVYTSAEVMAAERRILSAAALGGGRVADDTSIGLALLEAHAQGGTLNDGQQALVREMASSGARVQLALAPAGTGKTTAMAALASAWRNSGGTVVGLAPTAGAAEVLAGDLGTETDTIAKLVQLANPDPRYPVTADDPARHWFDRIDSSTLIVVDEAGKASTGELDAVICYAMARGASVRLVGDDHQLSSVSAGGVLRDIAARHDALTLSEVVRFGDTDRGKAEGAASLALRRGDPTGIAFYLDHNRIHVGADATAADLAYTAWVGDLIAGRDSILLAPTNPLVAELNERARADRLRLFPTEQVGPTVTLGDKLTASAGDWITTRENARWLRTGDRTWVKNGHRWVIRAVNDDGSLTVSLLHGNPEDVLRLPAHYVKSHTTLGYASTIDVRQGTTADTCHVVGGDRLNRQQLYVALTRGRAENHLYFSTSEADPHQILTPKALHPPTAADILADILQRDDRQLSAHTEIANENDATLRLGKAAAMYTDALHTVATVQAGTETMRAIDAAADALPLGLRECGAWPVLRRHLALLAVDGHDPADALAHAAARGDLSDANDAAAVLDWRLPPVSGGSGPGHGPLQWLDPIPDALAAGDAGDYLRARADLVAELAEQVRAVAHTWSAATVPTWGRALTEHPRLLAEVAVFRASHNVDPADSRITGPSQFVTRSAMTQKAILKRLDKAIRATDLGAARWRTVAESLDRRITRDPYWPQLATHLDDAARAGADIKALLADAMDRGGPLPDELPAAALWWRLAGSLSPATLDSANSRLRPEWTTELHRILGSRIAETVTADPAWPSLVAAVAASDWPPAEILEAAAEHMHDLAAVGDVRPDQICRLLAYRVELLSSGASSAFRDVPHPGADAAQQSPDAGADLHAEPAHDPLYEPPPDPYDLDYGYADDSLGDLDFDDLPRYRPTPSTVDADLTELRRQRDAARREVAALTDAIFRLGGGPAEAAAAAALTELHRRHSEQRPYQHQLAHAHAEWVAAEHRRDTHHSLLAQLATGIAVARAKNNKKDNDLADRFQAHRDELVQNTTAVDTAAAEARTERDAAHAALLDIAGGPDGIVTDSDLDATRRAAVDADIAALQRARIHARDLDNQVYRAEAATARIFAQQPRGDFDLSRELDQMREEIELVESAGLRSPATVYADCPAEVAADLSAPAQTVVSNLVDSDMAVQLLHVGDNSAEKAAIIRAVALAAHHSDAKVLAIPASPAAADHARRRRYSDAIATPAEAIDKLTTGEWKPPPGTLLIADDADQLDDAQLRRLATYAGSTNTKLLLVTRTTAAAGPTRHLTAALATTLPWSQHFGDTSSAAADSALARAATYLEELATTPPDDPHREATALLTRRDNLIGVYRNLATPPPARTRGLDAIPVRDVGLNL